MENKSNAEEMRKCAMEAGLSFDDKEDEKRFLDIVVEELEVRIGAEISSHCTNEELKEFDSLSLQEEVGKWLEKHVPDYKEIVKRNINQMKAEILEFSDVIMERKREKKEKRQSNT